MIGRASKNLHIVNKSHGLNSRYYRMKLSGSPPNFKLYYQASFITWITDCIVSPYGLATSFDRAELPDGLQKTLIG